MLKPNKLPPPGSFDYLLEGMDTEAPPRVTAPPPPILRATRERTGPVPATPPPAPPERGGGNNPRVHVEIEINHRIDGKPVSRPSGRPSGRPHSWSGNIMIAVFVVAASLGMKACSANAQPAQWETHKNGFVTESNGTDRNGNRWTARSYRQGFNTLTDIERPDGSTGHCTSYQQGWQTITNCQ